MTPCEKCGSSEIRVLRVIYSCPNDHHYVEEGDAEPIPPTPPKMTFKPTMNNPGQLRMPFGKHKGELIEDMPTDYIQWCLESLERLNSDIRKEMENQIALREGRGVVR